MNICELSIDKDDRFRDNGRYAEFITQLRECASMHSVSHNSDGRDFKVGILRDTKDRIPDVRIAMDGKIFILHLQNFDLYFLGYKLTTGEDWVSISKGPIQLNGQRAGRATGFEESYREMGLGHAIDLTKPRLGFKQIRNAMVNLERFFENRGRCTLKDLKEACATIVLMICEAARCETVSTDVQKIYKESGKIQSATAGLIKDWGAMCGEYFQKREDWDNYNGPLRLVKNCTRHPEMLIGESSTSGKGATSKWDHTPDKSKKRKMN